MLPRLVYYCRSHIWSINIFVLLQFEGNYFPRQSFLWCCQFQPGSHHHISSGESPTSLKTRVSILRSSLSLSFAPEKLRILTPFSKTLYTLKIFSLKLYALKLNNGQRLKKNNILLCECGLCGLVLCVRIGGSWTSLILRFGGFVKNILQVSHLTACFVINHQFLMQFIVKPMQGTQ